MKRLFTILISLAVSAAVVCLAYGVIKRTYSEGMAEYEQSINSAVEAKRAELLENSTFRTGVVVNDVSIGGMTYDEALAALTPVEKSLVKDVGFTIHYEDQTEELPKSCFIIYYNTKAILGEAIMLATEGELESIQEQIDNIASEGRYYNIDCTVKINRGRIEKIVRSIAQSVYVAPVDAIIVANPDSVYDKTDRFSYIEGENGMTAYPEEAIEEIFERAEALDFGDVTLRVESIEPEVTVEQLMNTVVMRSHYESSYSSGSYGAPNRLHNVKKACGLVNGTCVPPMNKDDPDDKSYIFSTNDCLGYRTEEDGWLPAPGFVDGGARSEDSPGGGVCHVSSTMYNAVIKADLKIVYRINHSSHVGYVPWGLDATIDSGRIDFKWANNTDKNIYVFMWVDTKKQLVCCEVWGEPFPDSFDYIDFYAEFVEEIEPTDPVYVEKSFLESPNWYVINKPKTGYKYESFKQYYKNGKPVGDPVRVAGSEYKMHPYRFAVWPGFNKDTDMLLPENKVSPPEPSPSPSPSPTP